MNNRVVRIALWASSCAAFFSVAFWADVTSAQTLYKNNTANVLTSTSSWWTTESGSTNPASITTTGTLWFGGSGQAATGTWALGGNLSVGALRLDNVTGTPNYSATISAGDTLTLNNASGITLNSAAGGSLTIACDVVAAAGQSWTTSRTLTMSGAVNTGTNQITVNTAGGSALMTISGAISGTRSGANVFLLQPTSASGGVLRLTNASNSYVGNIEFGSSLRSALEFTSAGALGASGTANQIRFRNTGGTAGAGSLLLYTGSTNETVTKTIQCDTSIGIRLESNSVGGSVKFNGAFNASTRPLYLGGTGTGDNELAIAFPGATVTKRDAGTWLLSATNSSYTGATTLAGGTLKVTKLANGAANSSIGASGTAAANLVFNGGTLEYVGAGDSTNRSFTITSSPAINANGSGALTWNGASPTFTTGSTAYVVTLGGTSTANNTWGTVLVDNGSGAVGLTKSGAGKWVISGSNSYSGTTTVSAGTLVFNSSNSLGSNLSGTSGSAVVQFGANTLAIGSSVAGNSAASFSGKLDGTGLVNLQGGSDTTVNSNGTEGVMGNSFTLAAATAAVPTSAFALDTGVSSTDRKDFAYTNNTNDVLTLSSLSGFGGIRSDSGGSNVTRFITVNQSGGDTTLNGSVTSHLSSGGVSRALTLTKQGTSRLTLAGFIGKQTLSGTAGAVPVNIVANGGLLEITNAANTTTANTDAIWSGTVTVTSGTLGFASQALVNTAGSAGVNSIRMDGGVLRWNAGTAQDLTAGASSRLTLVAGKTATFDTNGSDVTFANALGGGAIAAAVQKAGAGKLTLAADNTYTGTTTVSAGTLSIGSGGTAGSVAGDIVNNAALIFDRSNALAYLGAISGNGTLVKQGAGKLTLSANSSYTGATTVSAGTLLVNGSLANTSGLSVGAGGTLGGSGSIAATLSGAGLVSPGNSPGITTANAVDPTGGMSFAFEFTSTGSPTYGNSSASVNDVLRLTAGSPFTASLSGANVVDVYFDVTSLVASDIFRGGFYIDAGGDFISSVENASYQYWVRGDGTGTDRTFNGQGYFSLANFDAALTITKSTVAETADFGGGNVNGSVTQFVVVPEPATLGLMALGGLMGGFSLSKRLRSRRQ